jgi:hypothetical protein
VVMTRWWWGICAAVRVDWKCACDEVDRGYGEGFGGVGLINETAAGEVGG